MTFRCTTVAALLAVFVPAALPADEKPKVAKPVPLNKKGTVLLDKTNGRLLLKTKVVLREGQLEMLCCLKRTKEHESILALDGKAFVVHAGLLALGVKTGTPAKFRPKFVPAKGQELQIFARWTDNKGKQHRIDARKWLRTATRRYFAYPMKKLPAGFKLPDRSKSELRYDKLVGELLWFGQMSTKQRDELLKLSVDKEYQKAIKELFKRSQPKEMHAKWIFVGSKTVVDPATMRSHYLAEQGSLICVANFSTATVDISQQSSASAGSEVFEPYTERVPPLGTDVTLEIVPVKERKKGAAAKNRKRG